MEIMRTNVESMIKYLLEEEKKEANVHADRNKQALYQKLLVSEAHFHSTFTLIEYLVKSDIEAHIHSIKEDQQREKLNEYWRAITTEIYNICNVPR